GDQIQGVITGSALNNDGHTMGITTPSSEAQEEVIRAALQNAGLSADAISYVETHGTGTMIGDPIELKALTRAFRADTGAKQFCAVGSVKTNIGPLHSAAGIASLIKTVRAARAGELPSTLNCERPNPRFEFTESPFFPGTKLERWEARAGGRRAGVSSFGFGGTNCHMIVEEFVAERAPRIQARRSALPPVVFARKRYWPRQAEPAGQNRMANGGVERDGPPMRRGLLELEEV